jgi:hypothetical protein
MSSRDFGVIAGVVGALTALLLLLPSEPTEVTNWREKRTALPRDARACRARGGTWTAFGNLYNFCRLMTRDGGKACTSSSDCEGVCLVASTDLNSSKFDSCSSEVLLHGCYETRERDHVSTVCQD